MDSSQKPLFRAAALDAQGAERFGSILLLRPPSLSVFVALAACAGLVVTLFVCLESYTKRSTISGQLIPDTGIVAVYAQQSGVVIEKHVVEGQRVRRGDVLYVISSDRINSQGSSQASISGQVEARRVSMQSELENTRVLQTQQRATLEQTVAGLGAQLAALDGQLDAQRQRVVLASDSLRRYRGLLAKDYISNEQVQQRQEDVLDQQIRLQALQRDRLMLAGNLAAQRSELAVAPLTQKNQLAGIDRNIILTAEELTESEAKRRLVVVAPTAGIATALLGELGQTMDASRPLLSIVPDGARLQAHLYVPSHAIGFIKPGDAVRLRYAAFPYQKFGQFAGRVATVARVARPASELQIAGLPLPPGITSSEALYRVVVVLDRQTVRSGANALALQAGMTLQADVLQDSRRLYEWVLDPLLSLTRKLD